MPRSLSRQAEFHERAELLILSGLHILGKGASFRCCCMLTHIPTSEVSKFFLAFLDAIVDMKDEYIFLPANVGSLTCVMNFNESIGLLGACRLIDVVHVKWSKCPLGNYNRAKGKEGYPTMVFQVITDYNRRILVVNGPQFST
jgi:hypothetical protein